MKPIKKKCIVMTVRKTFMKDHFRADEETGFIEKIGNLILSKITYIEHEPLPLKIHTMRAGKYWRGIVDKVNAGTHYLSIRTWDGLPYRSKQTEFARFSKLGYQEINIDYTGVLPELTIDGISRDNILFNTLAVNDGFATDNFCLDFFNWFGFAPVGYKFVQDVQDGFEATATKFNGGIIHFTDFRY